MKCQENVQTLDTKGRSYKLLEKKKKKKYKAKQKKSKN